MSPTLTHHFRSAAKPGRKPSGSTLLIEREFHCPAAAEFTLLLAVSFDKVPNNKKNLFILSS